MESVQYFWSIQVEVVHGDCALSLQFLAGGLCNSVRSAFPNSYNLVTPISMNLPLYKQLSSGFICTGSFHLSWHLQGLLLRRILVLTQVCLPGKTSRECTESKFAWSTYPARHTQLQAILLFKSSNLEIDTGYKLIFFKIASVCMWCLFCCLHCHLSAFLPSYRNLSIAHWRSGRHPHSAIRGIRLSRRPLLCQWPGPPLLVALQKIQQSKCDEIKDPSWNLSHGTR